MIAFYLYSILALIANASVVKILYVSIQPGQWLDVLLKWQYRLQRWDLEGKVFLSKAGGYCELCFSHFITVLGFVCYAAFMQLAVGEWISAGLSDMFSVVFVNLVWYLVYVSIGTNLSLYFIVKLFQQ